MAGRHRRTATPPSVAAISLTETPEAAPVWPRRAGTVPPAPMPVNARSARYRAKPLAYVAEVVAFCWPGGAVRRRAGEAGWALTG